MLVKDVSSYIRDANQISFIIGAGASKSANIPLAGELMETIKTKYKHCLTDLPKGDHNDYGLLMGALAPSDRKELIQPLLDKSLINWGHIALASIIRHKGDSLQRILTFNFDLILERTASLLGMHLPVYDFAIAPTKDLGDLASPAIYHLHGQSYGLRLLNSKDETGDHQNELRPILEDTVRNHLTVVVGYSGEADPALEVIADAYNSSRNLIWLGYSDTAPTHLEPLLKKKYASYVGGCDFDLTMVEIARHLKCWPPGVIKNPPKHVLEELKDVARFPTALKKAEGDDLLTSLRAQLRKAAKDWEQEKDTTAKAQEAAISGKPQMKIENTKALSRAEREARAISAYHETQQQFLDAEEKGGQTALMRLKVKFDEIAKLAPDHWTALNARHYAARTLLNMDKSDDAYKLFKKLLTDEERVRGKDDPSSLTTRHCVARSLLYMDRTEEAYKLFKKLLTDEERVRGKDDPSTLTTRNGVARSLLEMGKPDEALMQFKKLLTLEERVRGKDDISTLISHHYAARCQLRLGNPKTAKSTMIKILEHKGYPEFDRLIFQLTLVEAHLDLDEVAEAKALFKGLLKKLKAHTGGPKAKVIKRAEDLGARLAKS